MSMEAQLICRLQGTTKQSTNRIRPIVLSLTAYFLILPFANAEAQFGRRQFGVQPLASPQFQMPQQHVAQSDNFIVFADSAQWATQVVQMAEQHRRELAKYWLGRELPAWPQRCPIHVQSAPSLGAAGETRYTLNRGSAGDWAMSVQGTPERVLDSVLPHEITHTIFASHFAKFDKYMPRWADEGACTTVEHESEKRKHNSYLHRFLRTGRGLAFNNMFRLKEYPRDILPLYAQGHSAVQFLLDLAGPETFIAFMETGMQTEQWNEAIRKHYEYESIGEFQTMWNKWLADGSPSSLVAYAPILNESRENLVATNSPNTPAVVLASNQSQLSSDPVSLASANRVGNSPATVPSKANSIGNNASSNSKVWGNNISWYQRRLLEVTGEESPKYDGRPSGNNTAIAARPLPESNIRGIEQSQPVTRARPQPAQYNGIEVLDWGSSPPVPGIQGRPIPMQYGAVPAMVPIYR